MDGNDTLKVTTAGCSYPRLAAISKNHLIDRNEMFSQHLSPWAALASNEDHLQLRQSGEASRTGTNEQTDLNSRSTPRISHGQIRGP